MAVKDLYKQKIADCLNRFSAVFDGATSSRLKLVDEFFNRFLPKDYKFEWEGASKIKREFHQSLLKLVGSYLAKMLIEEFYEPYHYSRQTITFPSPVSYEVLIPYAQPKTNFILYSVVPANTKAGDIAVFFFNLLEAPIVTESTEKWCKFMDSFLNKNKAAQPTADEIDNLLTNRRKSREVYLAYRGEAKIGSNIGILTDEPVIRLPCYNIPLQCCYEMVADKIIHYKGLSPIPLSSLLAKEKHMPSDLETFLSLCLWSTWERFGVKDHNKLRWLVDACDAEGFKCRYSTGQLVTFRRLMNRRFKTHLLTNRAKHR
jgi:hypothetical protein